MSDEFGQLIRGLHASGDTIVSTDTHVGVLGKKGTTYDFLTLDATTGALLMYASDLDIRDLSHTQDSVKVGDGTDFLAVNADGSINIGDISAGTQTNDVKITLDGEAITIASGQSIQITDGTDTLAINNDGSLNAVVTATDLDIRDLSHTQDSVKIGDGVDFLAINADGSINVAMSGAGANNTFHYGSANLVKDTLTTVVTRSPASTEYFKSILVSGAGLCEWQVLYGTTGSEAIIASFWTTPSSPTFEYDVPDSLNVSSTQTVIVKAYNREKGAGPGSDFTGHATLVRQ